jgi:predicted O-methyltransferase YrrM
MDAGFRALLDLKPGTIGLMSILIRGSRWTRLFEICTSNGYSTIWLAWTARATGGRVTSIERDPRKQSMADENVRHADLRDIVDLALGDTTEVVASLPGPFGFVFFDAARVSASAQLSLLVPKLTPDAMLLAGNGVLAPVNISGYLADAESSPGFEHLVVPIGKGLSVA